VHGGHDHNRMPWRIRFSTNPGQKSAEARYLYMYKPNWLDVVTNFIATREKTLITGILHWVIVLVIPAVLITVVCVIVWKMSRTFRERNQNSNPPANSSSS